MKNQSKNWIDLQQDQRAKLLILDNAISVLNRTGPNTRHPTQKSQLMHWIERAIAAKKTTSLELTE